MIKYINKILKDNRLFYILLFLIILTSYILGFIFNEDSAGGGKTDFTHEWTSFIEFKKFGLQALTSNLYESSRTPLFLLINKYNFFANDQFSFRLSNFIFNFFIFISFVICLIYQRKLSVNQIIIVSTFILLSPYFRSSSYWAHQENLPFLFYFISLIFLEKFKDNFKINFIFKVSIIAFISSLSFYSDQKFIFISFYYFLYLIFRENLNIKQIIKTFIIFFITSIPALYLFYIWDGILPKQSQFRIGFYKDNISASISIICFYFMPIALSVYKKIYSSVNKNDFVIFFLILALNLYCLPNFDSSWGNGVIFKLFYVIKNYLNINLLLLQLIFLIFIQFIFFIIYILIKNDLLNFLPIVIVIVISSLVERTYNEYFDPLISILIFTFFKFNKKLFIIDSKITKFYLVYLILFLVFANIYYNYFDLNTA